MKRFFQKVGAWLKKSFGSVKKVEQFIEEHVDDVIDVAAKILSYTSNPVLFSMVTAVLPEKYKNASKEAQEKMVDILTKAIDILGISNTCLHIADPYQKILCFVGAINSFSNVMKKKTALALATEMVKQQRPDLPTSVVDNMITGRIAEKKVVALMPELAKTA